jgi:hypothetical protein
MPHFIHVRNESIATVMDYVNACRSQPAPVRRALFQKFSKYVVWTSTAKMDRRMRHIASKTFISNLNEYTSKGVETLYELFMDKGGPGVEGNVERTDSDLANYLEMIANNGVLKEVMGPITLNKLLAALNAKMGL